MNQYQPLKSQFLAESGLNMQAIFDVNQLPTGFIKPVDEKYTQLIVFAHGGKELWRGLKTAELNSDNPVDDYSVRLVKAYFRTNFPHNQYKLLYPSNSPIGLRALGEYAGWHHDSPFRVGMNETWGSWFAYRVVLLADTNLPINQKIQGSSPCHLCEPKICLSTCPAHALETGTLVLSKCVNYRKKTESLCKHSCLSRVSCPVGKEHQYTEEQINYHYSVSLKMIRAIY